MMKQLILAGCAAIILSGSAYAGPCNTRDKDAGSGPTPGYTGQTTGTASSDTHEHPPTDTSRRQSDVVAGYPTATAGRAHRSPASFGCEACDPDG